MKAALTKKVDAYANDIRSGLREKRIPYSGVAREGQSISVRFRDAQAREKAMLSAFLAP